MFFSFSYLLSPCDAIRTVTKYLVDVFRGTYHSCVSVIKELALKWSRELWNLSFSMVLLGLAVSGSGHPSRVFPCSDGVADSCGQEDPMSAHSLRASYRFPCIPHSLSPLGRCCRDRWPPGSWASNEAHPFFFLLIIPCFTSCFNNTSIASVAHLAGQHAAAASHDHIHANPCLFISCHDSIAISCLVVVFTCQTLWDVLRNSWPVHTFHCWDGTFVRSEQRS